MNLGDRILGKAPERSKYGKTGGGKTRFRSLGLEVSQVMGVAARNLRHWTRVSLIYNR